MRQRIRSRLSYANVMSTLAVFLVLGGISYAATGGNFLLGKSNSASSTSSLTAPVNGKALNLTNTSTGAGATALGLNVASGHAPFTVNTGTKVANLNADKLDGQDSTAFLDSGSIKRLNYNANASASPAPITTIAIVGPYTLKGQCEVSNVGVVNTELYANGPAGTADVLYSAVRDDNHSNDLGTFSGGVLIPASTNTFILGTGDFGNHYTRIGGTAMLRTGSTLVQVDFNAVADSRPTANCFLYGTAMKAT